MAYGCKHFGYTAVKLLCPDEKCSKVFFHNCNVCHDDVMANHKDINIAHKMDNFAVKIIKCSRCSEVQFTGKTCSKCKRDFALYFYESLSCYSNVDLGIFECDKCKLPYPGKKQSSFHCDNCEACFSIESKESHECVVGDKETCSICFNTMKYNEENQKPSLRLPCGHKFHTDCLMKWFNTGKNTCPVCRICLQTEK